MPARLQSRDQSGRGGLGASSVSVPSCVILFETKMAARKKDGGPDWKYYESPETVNLFEPIKQYLLKNYKKVSYVELSFFILSA